MKRLILLTLGVIALSVSTVFAQQSQPSVLVEGLTNIACGNCPLIDGTLDTYDSTHSDVITVWVHTQWPNAKDPFYLASKTSSNYRCNGGGSGCFWAAENEPQAYVNGTNAQGSGGWVTDWKPVIQSYESDQLGAAITFTESSVANGAQLVVHCSGKVSATVNLNVELVESGIAYHNTDSYGDPPGAIWNNVLRQTLPAPAGTPSFVLQGSKDFTVTIDTAGTGWKLNHMKAVAFLQDIPTQLPSSGNNGDANIEGIGVYDFSIPTAVEKSSLMSTRSTLGAPNPNPSSAYASIPFTVAKEGNIRLVLTDLVGREVAVPLDRFMSAGPSSVQLKSQHLPSGFYQVRMYVDGALESSTKLMIAR